MTYLRSALLAVPLAAAFQIHRAQASIPVPPPAVLPAVAGGLQVIANAAGAKVYLDGQYKGELTPPQVLNVPDLPAGNVQVRVEAPGYQARALTYAIQPGAWTHALFLLVKRGGGPVSSLPVPSRVAPDPSAPLLPGGRASSGAAGLIRNAQGCWEIAVEASGVSIELVQLPPGRFRMGSASGGKDERPVHEISIRKPVWMSKFPVTQRQWNALKGSNPSRFKEAGPEAPVESVSYRACESFIDRLNEAQPEWSFRLPTEAEWEYACRAGSKGLRSDVSLKAVAWYKDNSQGTPHPVGRRQPNAWGLHDMLGNVWQWCQDLPHGDYAGAPGDGTAWIEDARRGVRALGSNGEAQPVHMVRGGSWDTDAEDTRSTKRERFPASSSRKDLGFRLVCVPR